MKIELCAALFLFIINPTEFFSSRTDRSIKLILIYFLKTYFITYTTMRSEEDIFSNTSLSSNVDEIDASLWNLTLQEIHEEESKSLENIKMKHICGPSIRSKLRN